MNFSHVLISAENRDRATAMLDALLEKKLILGGPIIEGPAKFWWKGEIVSMNYCYLLTYTIDTLQQAIINECEEVSMEEVPMVSFMPFEGNQKLKELIAQSLSS